MPDLTRHLPPQRIIDLANPAVRALAQSPLHGAVDKALIVLHIVGRKTGRGYDIPVGYVDLDGHFIVVTQHRWRANTRGGADVDVTFRGRRRRMHCVLDEDPRSVVRTIQQVADRLGPKAMQRLTGLKTPDGTEPSFDQLEEAVRAFDLATLTLSPAFVPRDSRSDAPGAPIRS